MEQELGSNNIEPSPKKVNAKPLIVDLTNEEGTSSNEDSEDSDYKMALMLSQEEIKSINDEEKIRKDRERADFQMALRLSQADDLDDDFCNEAEPENLNMQQFRNTEGENLSNIELPNIDFIPNDNDSRSEKNKDSIKAGKSSPQNPFLPPSPDKANQSRLLSDFENESMLFRQQSDENYSFTDTVEITPPIKLISTPLSKSKRNNEAFQEEDNYKMKKLKYSEEPEIEILSGLSKSTMIDDQLSNQSQHCTSQKKLFKDDPVFQNPPASDSSIILPKDNNLGDDDSISTKKINSGKKSKSNKKTSNFKGRKSDTHSDSNKKLSGRKKYIHKPGSGGYAILIALFYNESSPNYKGYLTKDELIDAAQPFANQSMRYSNPGDKFTYCGYSASSILLKKELIIKEKKPVQIRYV